MTSKFSDTNQLKDGNFAFWKNTKYIIQRVNWAKFWVELKNMRNEQPEIAPIDEFIVEKEGNAPAIIAESEEALERAMQIVRPNPILSADANLPDNHLKFADKIIDIVKRVQSHVEGQRRLAVAKHEPFKRVKAIDLALRILKIDLSRAQYYVYEKRYLETDGNKDAIAITHRKSSFRQTQFSDAELHFIHQMIMRYKRILNGKRLYQRMKDVLEARQYLWVDPQLCGVPPDKLIAELLDLRFSTDLILQNPESAEILAKIELPSRSWFYDYLKFFKHLPEDGREFVNKVLGEGAWEEVNCVFDSFVHKAQYSNQFVFADHYLVDIFNVDEETRTLLFRLTFTAFIDAYSRGILGRALLAEGPGIVNLAAGMKHAIWPKNLEKYDIDKPWVCCGLFQFLLLDNAWPHLTETIEEIAMGVREKSSKYPSIEIVLRVPYMARQGALIERFFGNLSAIIKQSLHGAIKNSDPRTVQNAAKAASLIFNDIDKFLMKTIVRYMHTPHSSLNEMTPTEKWLEGMKFIGGPKFPPLTDKLERLFWRKLTRPVTIQKEGIPIWDLTYQADELDILPKKLHHSSSSDGAENLSKRKMMPYTVRYSSENISRMALYLDGEYICDVYAKQFRLADGSYKEVSKAEFEIAKDLAKQRGIPIDDWVEFIEEMNELIRIRLNERKVAMRKAMNNSPEQPPRQSFQQTKDSEEVTQADIDAYLNNLLASRSKPSKE